MSTVRYVSVSASNGKFGFRLAGNLPVVISGLDPQGVAQRCGLRNRDAIMSINGQDVVTLRHETLVALISKECRRPIKFGVKQFSNPHALKQFRMELRRTARMGRHSSRTSFMSTRSMQSDTTLGVDSSFASVPSQVQQSDGTPKRYSKLPLLSQSLLDMAPEEVPPSRAPPPDRNQTSLHSNGAIAETTNITPISQAPLTNGSTTIHPVVATRPEVAPGATPNSPVARHADATREAIRTASLAKRYRKLERDREQFHALSHTMHVRKLRRDEEVTLSKLRTLDEDQVKASTGVAGTVQIVGRAGETAFVNGIYELRCVLDGRPIYRHKRTIPANVRLIGGETVFLYFHEANEAWTLSAVLGSMDVLAYVSDRAMAPQDIAARWNFAEPGVGYKPNPSVAVVEGSTMKKRVSFSGALPTKENPNHVYPGANATAAEHDEYARSLPPTPTPSPAKGSGSALLTGPGGQSVARLLVDDEVPHELDEYGGYYDPHGGYVDKEGGYTDAEGFYYDVNGTYLGYYDEAGTFQWEVAPDSDAAVNPPPSPRSPKPSASPSPVPEDSGEFQSFVKAKANLPPAEPVPITAEVLAANDPYAPAKLGDLDDLFALPPAEATASKPRRSSKSKKGKKKSKKKK